MAVLALALITASVVAAFAATNAETVANNAMRAQDRAYQLAEAGLQQFLVRREESNFCDRCWTNPANADSEYTKVKLTGGYANVVAVRLRGAKADGTPALFFIRSTGVDTSVRLSGAGRMVYASRTIGFYATFGTASMRPLAAWTSLNGLTNSEALSGMQVPIAGDDACGAGTDLAGAVIAAGGQYSGNGRAPTGNPGLDSSMIADSVKARVGIDWEAIVRRDAILPQFEVPTVAWPRSWQFSDYPIVRVKGNLTLPGDGKGLLIVDSNLVISGNYDWDGIILVGGTLTASGSGIITGAVVTGLNRTLPGAAPDAGASDNDVISYRNKFYYNSCRVTNASQKLNVYFALTNTWMDNVAMW